MKGIILYGAKSKNTKEMAQAIYQVVKEEVSVDLQAMNKGDAPQEGDFYLVGGSCRYGRFYLPWAKDLKNFEGKPVGLFATAGSGHTVNFKLKFKSYLNGLLVGQSSLGTYVCPGTIHSNFYGYLKMMPNFILNHVQSQTRESGCRDLSLRNQLLQVFSTARPASSEELEDAGKYFLKKLTGSEEKEKDWTSLFL